MFTVILELKSSTLVSVVVALGSFLVVVSGAKAACAHGARLVGVERAYYRACAVRGSSAPVSSPPPRCSVAEAFIPFLLLGTIKKRISLDCLFFVLVAYNSCKLTPPSSVASRIMNFDRSC